MGTIILIIINIIQEEWDIQKHTHLYVDSPIEFSFFGLEGSFEGSHLNIQHIKNWGQSPISF
jgi:hypothetical protein